MATEDRSQVVSVSPLNTPSSGACTQDEDLHDQPQASGSDKFNAVVLPGHDLWMTFVKNVHILPSTLDVGIFRDALTKCALVFPHVTGRLRKPQDPRDMWMIQLADNQIPLEVERCSSPICLQIDQEDGHEWVIQDDLNSYLNQPSDSISGCMTENMALCRVKLTMSKGQTAIGISWHHTLGDATVLLRFTNLLSQFYQGLTLPYMKPTFSKQLLSVLTPSDIDKMLPYMTHLSQCYTPSDMRDRYAQQNRGIVRLDYSFRLDQLEKLREAVSEDNARNNFPYRVSIQDVLTSYVVNVLSRCSVVRIRKATNAASYRNVGTTVCEPEVAGNAIFIIHTTEFDHLDIPTIAKTVRLSICHCRNMEYVEQWIRVASDLMLKAANENKNFFFAADPTVLTVNSNLSLNWRSAHFGHPNSVRFFTSGTNRHYLRVFLSNPCSSEEGPWSSRNTVDVSLGVRREEKDKIVETFSQDLDNVHFPYNLVTVLSCSGSSCVRTSDS